jgi:hypothetical protein
MKLPKAYLDYIDKLIFLVKAKAVLPEYDFSIRHVKELKDRRYPNGYTAEVTTDTRYLQVKMAISGKLYKQWRNKQYKEMVELIAHELTHIYTDPYYEFFWEHVPKKFRNQIEHVNEQQTERLTKLILLNIKPKEYLP